MFTKTTMITKNGNQKAFVFFVSFVNIVKVPLDVTAETFTTCCCTSQTC